MPAFGTGQLGYSPDKVSQAMVAAVINFWAKNMFNTITDIYMVIYDQDIQTRKVYHCTLAGF